MTQKVSTLGASTARGCTSCTSTATSGWGAARACGSRPTRAPSATRSARSRSRRSKRPSRSSFKPERTPRRSTRAAGRGAGCPRHCACRARASRRRGGEGAASCRQGVAESMPRLPDDIVSRIREVEADLGVLVDGGPPALEIVPPALCELLSANKALVYTLRPGAEGVCLDQGFCEGLPREAIPVLDGYISGQTVAWAAYNPTRPEPRQRNKTVGVEEMVRFAGVRKREEIPISGNFSRAAGSTATCRVLICDGPRCSPGSVPSARSPSPSWSGAPCSASSRPCAATLHRAHPHDRQLHAHAPRRGPHRHPRSRLRDRRARARAGGRRNRPALAAERDARGGPGSARQRGAEQIRSSRSRR